jgi:hypothetical protein
VKLFPVPFRKATSSDSNLFCSDLSSSARGAGLRCHATYVRTENEDIVVSSKISTGGKYLFVLLMLLGTYVILEAECLRRILPPAKEKKNDA